MYLVDTNVWLERLLDQERSDEGGHFLDKIPSEKLFITDFSLHSIGVILSKFDRSDVLLNFVQDNFVDSDVSLIRLEPEDMKNVVQRVMEFQFDFDDAYQYTAAEKYSLILVSFDGDFDRTPRGRKTPSEIVA